MGAGRWLGLPGRLGRRSGRDSGLVSIQAWSRFKPGLARDVQLLLGALKPNPDNSRKPGYLGGIMCDKLYVRGSRYPGLRLLSGFADGWLGLPGSRVGVMCRKWMEGLVGRG